MILSLLAFVLAIHPVKPSWSATVGSYKLLKWVDHTGKDRETLVIRDSKGRGVASMTDYHVGSLGDLHSEKPLRTWDVDRDGIPEVVIETWSGGAHGSNSYHVWSLGPMPRCLLAYERGNVSDQHDLDIVDLDGDGRQEIRTWYDGFAYVRGGSNWQTLPVVLKLERGRFVDRTSRYERLLRQAADRAWEELSEADVNRDPAARSGPGFAVVSLICSGEARASRASTFSRLKRALPSRSYRYFRKQEPEILAIYRDRISRYSYPSAYQRKPAHVPYEDRK